MQTRKHSFIESWTNLAIGYLIALVAQFLVYPALGIPVSVGQNFVIVTIFTALSLVRSYTIRRWFNKKAVLRWTKVADGLPVIPEGNYAVAVLTIEHDPVYAEISGGHGNSVTKLLFDKEGFKTRYIGGKGESGLMSPGDEVTHWMYKDSLLNILPAPQRRKKNEKL